MACAAPLPSAGPPLQVAELLNKLMNQVPTRTLTEGFGLGYSQQTRLQQKTDPPTAHTHSRAVLNMAGLARRRKPRCLEEETKIDAGRFGATNTGAVASIRLRESSSASAAGPPRPLVRHSTPQRGAERRPPPARAQAWRDGADSARHINCVCKPLYCFITVNSAFRYSIGRHMTCVVHCPSRCGAVRAWPVVNFLS